MASPSHKVLFNYPLRDQSGRNALERKSMRIGKMKNSTDSVWISFDKRPPMGDHSRYWSQDNKQIKYAEFHNKLDYAEGLELSRFSSKKKTKSRLLQGQNQKALIQKIYQQDGKQYEGDLEAVEKTRLQKNEKSTKKRALTTSSTTPKTPRRTRPNSDPILDQFQHKAFEIPNNTLNRKKIYEAMLETWYSAPSLEILYESLQEAHRRQMNDASETAPYVKWLAHGGHTRYTGDDADEESGSNDDSDTEENGSDDSEDEPSDNEQSDESKDEENEEGEDEDGGGKARKGKEVEGKDADDEEEEEEEGDEGGEGGDGEDIEDEGEAGEKDIADEDTTFPQVEGGAEDDSQESQQRPGSQNGRSEPSLTSTSARNSDRALHGGQSSSSNTVHTPLGPLTRSNFDEARRAMRMLRGNNR